ncbi:MAG: tRNA (adenosine(37)-N6)-dimethylallyltransferase MiaA [Gemmatimonadota bacterium]|jgi:tRNA dimethylallyltransferase
MADPGTTEGRKPVALVITGPTATGKTALSLDVAERLDGEIISMDSRQVYRGMDIGTAKVTPDQRARVPHHGLDLVDPDERYSAGRFARDARRWIEEIRARGHTPILVGGTGFFLRALTHPLFREPEMPERAREALKRWLERQPEEKLRRWLADLDPATARTLEASGGRQRVARALEVALLTGRPLSWWHRHAPPETPPLPLLIFVLWLPREQLYRRINDRVLEMIEAGWVDEVRALLERGYDLDDPGMVATGYPELVAYLRGEWSLEEAIEATQRATRRYARRQLTWFRHQLPPGAIWLDASRPRAELVDTIVDIWNREDL